MAANVTQGGAGKILVPAVRVKGYTRADGVRVKSFIRPAHYITDRGAPGRGARKIEMGEKGLLEKYGYSEKLSEGDRHAAVRKAIRAEGGVKVVRRLNAAANLQHRTNPTLSKRVRADSEYASGIYARSKRH